jgi:hypothetical protein
LLHGSGQRHEKGARRVVNSLLLCYIDLLRLAAASSISASFI